MAYNKQESYGRKKSYLAQATGNNGFNYSQNKTYFDIVINFEDMLEKDIIDFTSDNLYNMFKCLQHLEPSALYWLYINILTYLDFNKVTPNPCISIHPAVNSLYQANINTTTTNESM